MPTRPPTHKPQPHARKAWDKGANAPKRIAGRAWRRLRLQVFARDMYRCQRCGRVTGSPECDHVKPLSAGGTDDMHNLQTLCVDCHARKTLQEANGGRPVRHAVEIGMDGYPVERAARVGL